MMDAIIVASITAIPTIFTAYWTYKIKSKPVMNGKFDKLCDTVEHLKDRVEIVQEKVYELQNDFIDFKQENKKV